MAPAQNTSGIAALASGSGTVVVGNEISAGTANAGSAWGIWGNSTLSIDANRINLSQTAGACPNSPGGEYCGGIASLSGTMTITNNVVFGLGAVQSAAVMLMEAEMPAGAVILNANTLNGSPNTNSGSSPQRSAAVVLRIGSCTGCGFRGFVGKLRNNILTVSRGSSRFGIYEEAPFGRTQHPVALENNLFSMPSPISSSDALYRYFNGSSATPLGNITQVNGLATQIPSLIVGNNLSGGALLDATFHLQAGSPALDKGTATESAANGHGWRSPSEGQRHRHRRRREVIQFQGGLAVRNGDGAGLGPPRGVWGQSPHHDKPARPAPAVDSVAMVARRSEGGESAVAHHAIDANTV